MSASLPESELFALSEIERLKAVHRFDVTNLEPEQAYDAIVSKIAHRCGVPLAAFSLIDVDHQWIKARVGFEQQCTSRRDSFCTHAIQQDDILLVEDAHCDARFYDNVLVCGEPYIRFYAGKTIFSSDGYAVGTLCVLDRVPRQLDGEQLRALRSGADELQRAMAMRALPPQKSLEHLCRSLLASLQSNCAWLREAEHDPERVAALDDMQQAVDSLKDLLEGSERAGASHPPVSEGDAIKGTSTPRRADG